MINTHKLKKRDLYLKKIIAFKDTEPVKVVTGIRRCGKSSLLKLMVEHLKESGINDEQIIEMNFESHDFKKMTADDFYHYVKARVIPQKRMYLFFDELQRIKNWEDTVNSFRVDFDCDIYITGSNAYLLSSEYATYLSGRCVEIKMQPLSFKEFLYFHDFEIRESKSALGGTRMQIVDQSGEHYELREVFDAYMRFGGMPGIADVGLDQEKAMVLLDGIYSTVIVRDILEREKRRGQRQITDPILLRKIVLFLADNIGSSVSVSSIGNTLVSEGLLEDGKRKGAPSAHTVQAYVNALLESYFYYDIKRFDIVVVDYPDEPLIKRVVGLPGEKIEYRNNKLYINDKLVKENFEVNGKTGDYEIIESGESVIPDDMYFVMGDNRINSTDSRSIGPVKKEQILGKANFVLYPFNKFGLIK